MLLADVRKIDTRPLEDISFTGVERERERERERFETGPLSYIFTKDL